MARIIPSDISRLALSGAPTQELETLQQLKTELPSDYTVFHGVHWSREYAAWTHFGEIDFVVLNRSGDVLFIEQKNGTLEESAAGLIKRYGQSEKNVADQIHRSVDKVREKYKWQNGSAQPLVVDYLIYCPDYRVKQLNAAGLSSERVVDAAAKDGLVGRIQTILGPGRSARDGRYEQVEEFFYQTFELVPDIHAHIGSQEKQFVHQSGALADILTHLEMEPFRLRIMGTAGSGKSLCARRFLEREFAAQHRVLLVCYNRPLADRLRVSVGEAGMVNTFYGFCDDFLKSRGQALNFDDMGKDPAFWQRVQEQVMDEEIPEEWKFDALIVDEGQDFEADWFEILRLFLKTGANILWLEDPDQNLQDRPPVSMEGFVRYRTLVNYRSPESIAQFIRGTLPIPFEQGSQLPGLGVAVHPYSDVDEQPRLVGKTVQTLLRHGFSHDDIVVISCRGAQNSVFSRLDKIGGVGLRHFSGEYDSTGRQIMTEGKLTFDSVYRFKGQEAPAVILVDVDPREDRLEREERLLFCGMTRATVRLELVVNRENAYNRRFIAK
jgi:hypothetical protein